MQRKLQTNPETVRRLKIIGFTLLSIGLLSVIVAFVDFFAAFGDFGGQPKLFFLFFIGFPLLAASGACLSYAYMGKATRYAASQTVPVMSDAIHDIAADNLSTAADLSSAIHGTAKFCPFCGSRNGDNDKFCPSCGKQLLKTCPKCGRENKTDSQFCGNCGEKF